MLVKEVGAIDRAYDIRNDLSSVWIIGHVLSGWDGSAAQINPTNLCK